MLSLGHIHHTTGPVSAAHTNQRSQEVLWSAQLHGQWGSYAAQAHILLAINIHTDVPAHTAHIALDMAAMLLLWHADVVSSSGAASQLLLCERWVQLAQLSPVLLLVGHTGQEGHPEDLQDT
jgi:hypothetical protein